ncbi:proline-rich transmembrane protein 4 [Hyla sarda]|uniref:proline-rich transmembrane protein 4 n=1 Tax=Hyla sarda TaxID=327740 RepID=UPI0024C2FADC|nr:proline-rich transmembrane protein 4 [Hyla sarda]XP_056429067.1 proline-rich transmembrane protein 4 [Hyla sarda]XP_056429068.1 proline-rich transmembrane protein 4 [Hyla sarda]XP_056429069.1 proline-rich transmembrane protein 4 [Hyla sarda]XP_056429070.1 proline-rich transmembrane protein 4 [Hyla sarda]
MGISYWTSIHFVLLACIPLSLQEIAPTKNVSLEDEEWTVQQSVSPVSLAPVTEYPYSVTPAWTSDDDAPFSNESHTDVFPLHVPTLNIPVLESDQLSTDMTNMFLLDKSQETDEYVQTVTPSYELSDQQVTEFDIVEHSMVPLVEDSFGSESPWPEISSGLPFTPIFSTVDSLTEPIYKIDTSLEKTLSPLLEEEDEVHVHTTVFSSFEPWTDVPVDSSLPYISDISKQAVTDPQVPEDQPIEMVSSEVPTKEITSSGEATATENAPFIISDVIPEILEDLSDEDIHEAYGEVSTLASTVTVNITDAGFVSHGSTSPTDPAFWDCTQSSSEKCDFSMTQRPTPHEADPTLHGLSPLLSSPPLFITLHADWNTSVAEWGVAWEALVYGSVGLYGTVALLALLSIFCLVFRCPSGGFYFSLLHLLLIALGSSRAFSLFYDAYGHQDRLPAFTALLLHDLAFPCMTSSFSISLLLLCSRCRLQHSSPGFPRLCLVASAAFLHFICAGGTVVVVVLLQQFPFLLLVSRGFYVLLTVVLSFSFFIFCYIARTQSTQIYDLKSSAPPTEYISGCPFANLKDWCRATHVVLLSACFGLLNAGLQLYAVLYALGYGGSIVFGPWPWWAFQLSLSLCEVGICLPLALIGAYPIFCANEIGRTNCWTQIFRLSPGHVTMKAPILQTNHQWASSQHEKLLVCDTIARSDSEFFPLYTLVEKRLSHGEDLSLIYHSNKSLEVPGLSIPQGSNTPSYISVQIDSDSTVDFRPPSPINLGRSIDEALFSESLIPKSLFHGTTLSSSLSLTVKSSTQMEDCVFKEKAADRGLYRTSSCMEIEAGLPLIQPIPSTRHDTPASSSPGAWRGEQSTASSVCKMSLDGSSLVLCSSPEHVAPSTCNLDGPQEPGCKSKAEYHALTPPSQESLDSTAQAGCSLRDDLINVFGPIDALSVCSDTIDL